MFKNYINRRKYMNKTIRYGLYILIIAICVISICVGVYAQFFRKQTGKVQGNDVNESQNHNIVTEQDVKQAFLDLFTNEIYSNYDETKINKLDNTKDLVYTAYTTTETVQGKYNIDFNIPMINIAGEKVNEYNNITQKVFVDKINAIMANSKVYTIYNLDYIAYVNNDVLSVAIKANIKEGENPQRTVIQTYNYDLVNNKDVTLEEIIEYREIEQNILEEKINETIQNASTIAQRMAQSGYQVYQRNLDNDIYKIENIKNFIQGPNGELYIIFAYGNNNYTSEIDIVEI